MTIRLSPENEAIVRAKIAAGGYLNEDQVITDALSLLVKYQDAKGAMLDAALEEGLADLREGRFIEVSSKEELEALFANL